jgi:hypothetical protein
MERPDCRIPRTAATAAVLCVLLGLVSAARPAIEVSDLLVPLGPGAVWDLGLGIVEAAATATQPEPDPAVRSSAEARERAIAELRAAVLGLPLHGGSTVGQLPAETREALERGLARAPIVGEWRDEAGSVTAVARMRLVGDPTSALPLLIDPGADAPVATSRMLPALVVCLEADDILRPALLPRVLAPDGTPAFDDPEIALRRGAAPYRYYRSREEAFAALEDGQGAFEVTGRAEGEERIDLALQASALEQLARERLSPRFADLDSVLVVAPGLELAVP